MKSRLLLPLILAAPAPALAASGPFLSLYNTDFVVLLSFLTFVGVLVYLKVPGKIGGLLDKRAATIKAELDEARALREEAQTVFASYERKQKEVQEQAEKIVATARREAELAAEKAKDDLRVTIEHRLAAADERIEAVKAGAVREVRDRAVSVAVAAAAEVIAQQMTPQADGRLIDAAIADARARLH